jgi:antitoxin (DNA-binding transcriptional repressor) of toxin-antitoxin stability system
MPSGVQRLLFMATFDLEYAKEHLEELFHDARLGEEVIIVREDGKSCELTPLAEVPAQELSTTQIEIPQIVEGTPGDMVPA